MSSIRIKDMFVGITVELTTAYVALSDAADWARSDWSDRRALTDDEAAACAAVFTAVHNAKQAINQAKSAIDRAVTR